MKGTHVGSPNLNGISPMPAPGFWQQMRVLVGQGARAELADRERLISPVLFAVTLLLLFAFAMGDIDEGMRQRLYVAETFLTAFFALQLSFSRLFEPDRQDRVFDLIRTYPVSHTAWFVAKYLLVLMLGSATLAPTLVIGAFLNQTQRLSLFSWFICGVGVLALMGLAALGVLLSALTLKAQARQILYPLLYFPLTAPVLLAATQASLAYMNGKEALTWIPEAAKPWLGLLLAFDTIYLTLGVLLFTELVEDG